jgi:energy-coupling factor transport system permease protein
MTWQLIGSVRDSPLRRLDFRAKLALLAAVTVLAFLWENPWLNAGLAGLLLVLCLLAGIRPAYIARLLRIMLPFYAIVLLTHGLWNTSVGRTALWTAPEAWPWVGGQLQLTSEGLAYGAMVIFRTLALILAIPLSVFTTDLNALIFGLVRLGVPYRVAFAFSATLRFVPLLLGEVQAITEAQRLRGLALERMGIGQRLRVYSRVAVPLILSAMSKSQQIEVVLASRAFSGSAERTYLHEARLTGRDWALLCVCVLVVAAALLLRCTTGIGRFAWPH